MTPSNSSFDYKELTSKHIESLANRYLDIRSSISNNATMLLSGDNPAFASLDGFSADALKEIIRRNAKPVRIDKAKRMAFNDIYRSDLGELLLVNYFENECSTDENKRYIIPVKNIWDRELDSAPGRGFDAIGYNPNNGRPSLLVGEAKVSGDLKSPPPVVDQTDDSIFKNHSRTKTDTSYLEQRIANYVRKVGVEHKVTLSAILFSIGMGFHDKYEIVYGCCLVRDKNCYKDTDYGKMKTEEKIFSPGKVHFVIFSFDETISKIVESFYNQIEAA